MYQHRNDRDKPKRKVDPDPDIENMLQLIDKAWLILGEWTSDDEKMFQDVRRRKREAWNRKKHRRNP